MVDDSLAKQSQVEIYCGKKDMKFYAAPFNL